MSAKAGIFHDYDLQANQESSASAQVCEVCDVNPMRFQWSDYSGEAMCTQCGAPYQLKWGSDAQVKHHEGHRELNAWIAEKYLFIAHVAEHETCLTTMEFNIALVRVGPMCLSPGFARSRPLNSWTMWSARSRRQHEN